MAAIFNCCLVEKKNNLFAETFLENNLWISMVINNEHCSINSKFKKFNNLFIETINKHVPLRKKPCKELH